ncbi:hypothetical protein BGZ61DRAFT_520729 [Ilyonectria robusta]|uniref:uncharacterized protein n=1 Tax=Ilyonectria robusta TaxID=1079257 RepID=UPI001E8CA932|nr:uncharacterized protein BGZ61DRAFT_520729 [Ilyonectria robusta]KAH8677215.1 hypothetical protein BGZ61DRAFT_520729 [Ilyonectria robusta]
MAHDTRRGETTAPTSGGSGSGRNGEQQRRKQGLSKLVVARCGTPLTPFAGIPLYYTTVLYTLRRVSTPGFFFDDYYVAREGVKLVPGEEELDARDTLHTLHTLHNTHYTHHTELGLALGASASGNNSSGFIRGSDNDDDDDDDDEGKKMWSRVLILTPTVDYANHQHQHQRPK